MYLYDSSVIIARSSAFSTSCRNISVKGNLLVKLFFKDTWIWYKSSKLQWIPTVMLGGRYSLNMVTKFSTVSYSIMCLVLSKISSDSCIVYLPVVYNICCLNWYTFSRMLCVLIWVWLFRNVYIAVCNIIYLYFWGRLSMKESHLFISTFGFLSEIVNDKDWLSVCISTSITPHYLCISEIF